jgi:hypothetical protein
MEREEVSEELMATKKAQKAQKETKRRVVLNSVFCLRLWPSFVLFVLFAANLPSLLVPS